MNRLNGRRLVVGLCVVALVISVSRCAGNEASSSVLSPATQASQVASAAIAPEAARAAVSRGLLPHGRASVNWMAELHTASMQDFLSHRGRLRAMGKNGRCAGIEQMLSRQLPRIVSASGASSPAVYSQAVAVGLKHIGCASTGTLSLWTVPAELAAGAGVEGDTVTGAFLNYTSALEDAMLASSDPDDAAARMDAVLASATDLPTADAEVLAGIASLGASSAYYWYSYEMAGGDTSGGTGGTEIAPSAMSIFSACGYWCHIGWADLVGSVAGAAGAVVGSGGLAAAVPQIVLGSALVGGASGSAGAAF